MVIENRKEVLNYLVSAEHYSLDDLCLLVRVLRAEGGCPWDREQDHHTIRKDLLEETYEVIEAIDTDNPELMREELGDLLMQVVFHAQISTEDGQFNMDDVIHDICVKLIHRHPHVFGSVIAETTDQVLSNWEQIKKNEKHRDTVTGQLKAVPPMLPALMRAEKIGKKAKMFDFPDTESVFDKLEEETCEVRKALESGERESIDEEIGDLLFTAVSLARKAGTDPEKALYDATEKFIARFERLEAEVKKDGHEVADLTMPELDAIWDRIKHKTE